MWPQRVWQFGPAAEPSLVLDFIQNQYIGQGTREIRCFQNPKRLTRLCLILLVKRVLSTKLFFTLEGISWHPPNPWSPRYFTDTEDPRIFVGFFSPLYNKISLHGLSTHTVSNLLPSISLFFNITCLYSLAPFKISSLLLVSSNSVMVCLTLVFFILHVLGVHWASWSYAFTIVFKFRNVSAVSFWNIFLLPISPPRRGDYIVY